jgi:hypothetical protein
MKEWKSIAIIVLTNAVLFPGAILLWLAYVPLVIFFIFIIFIVLVNTFLGAYLGLKEDRKSIDAEVNRQRRLYLKPFPFLPGVYQLGLDGDSITFRKFFSTKTFDLSDIQEVQVKTTDQGPFACDVFIVLRTSKGKCTIPQEVPGSFLLLQKLQELPGFSNEAYIDAMSCCENRRFLCWKKQNG